MELETYKEQLVKIKSTKAVFAGKIMIWLFAALAAAAFFMLALRITPFLMLLSAGILYLAYKLCNTMNIEYEYLCVNGSFDVDKIVNKASRKNVLSFDLKDVESIEKWADDKAQKVQNLKVHQCTDDLQNAWVFTVKANKKGRCKAVILPNDEMKRLMKRFLAPSVARSFSSDS